ncbi:amino acid ABC transporter permease [Burkholderia sp. MR1-5-21]
MKLDFSIVTNNLGYLASGFTYTLELTTFAIAGGMTLGLLLAVARISPVTVVSRLAGWYVTLMRSIPLILVLFWIFFLLPLILQWVIGSDQPIKVDAKQTAILTFILFEAAYFCEIIRSGIRSIRSGQWAAGAALGLSRSSVLTFIVLPQAMKNMIPIFLTQIIVLFQDTSLVYVISATDLVGAASRIGERDASLVEPYLFVAAVYLAVSLLVSGFVRRLEKPKFV